MRRGSTLPEHRISPFDGDLTKRVIGVFYIVYSALISGTRRHPCARGAFRPRDDDLAVIAFPTCLKNAKKITKSPTQLGEDPKNKSKKQRAQKKKDKNAPTPPLAVCYALKLGMMRSQDHVNPIIPLDNCS